MTTHIVKGRSQDGTVYATGHGMWGSARRDAKRMTLPQAEQCVADRLERNKEVDPDFMIGRLEIIGVQE